MRLTHSGTLDIKSGDVPFGHFSSHLVLVTVKMWKLLVTAAIVINIGEAQRSSYAPRPGSNSKLLPRFRKNETDSGLGTRGGQEDDGVSSTTLPQEGTLEDHRFVHRVSQWPEDRQPFWFKNRYAISSMRDRNIDGGDIERPSFENQRPRPQFQSPFQGTRPRGTTISRERNGVQLVDSDASYRGNFGGDILFPDFQQHYRD